MEMPADATVPVRRKIGLDQIWQLLHDIVVHTIVRSPWGLRCVDIETRPLPEVIGRIVRDALAAGAGVRCDDDDYMLGCIALHSSLGDEILLGAG